MCVMSGTLVATVAMKITSHRTRSVFDRDEITTEEDLTDAARSSCPLLARRTTASCAKPEGRKLSLVVRNGRSLASVGPNRG
jgi:hypothetical protein